VAVQVKPRPFDVVVTMALDRTGRESIETSYVLKRIIDAGVRVICYTDGREVRLDAPIDKAMLGLQGFASEDFRYQITKKTAEALLWKFEHGYATGGAPFGYQVIPARDGSGNKELEIVPDHAAIVVRIFTLIAGGKGLRRVLHALNAESVVNPSGKPWSVSNLREIVHRALYHGEAVYGRTSKSYKHGTEEKTRTDASLWHRRPAEHLRIVDESLWQRAQARLQQTRACHARNQDGQLRGKPESGIESPYLLAGFLVCGACGAKLRAVPRPIKKGPRTGATVVTYECWNYRDKGPTVCSMKSRLPVEHIDQAVIYALTHDILTPDLLDKVLQAGFASASQQRGGAEEQRERVLAELSRLDGVLKNLVATIERGEASQAVLGAIRGREAEQRDLRAKLEHLDGLQKAAEDQAWTLEQVREVASTWQDFLGLSPAGAKPYLRRILTEPVVVTKTATGWSYQLQGVLQPVLKGLIDHVEAPAETQAGAGEVHNGEAHNERADRVPGTR
jgi:site-specific DNA recombinase